MKVLQGPGDSGGIPYTLIGTVRGFRVNNDGTFIPIVTITAVSKTYGVQFSFDLTAATFETDGGPPLTYERTGWVDEVCSLPHVQGFRTEKDQGPDQVLYNYAHIVVGTDDGAITDEAVARMDHLNDASTFQAIDDTWARLVAMGAS